MSDEKRDLNYIVIDKKNFEDSFIPTFNEINDYYKNNLNLYSEKEKRSFIQFNFKTFDEAKTIKNKIENFTNFNEILLFANNNNIKYNIFQNLTKNEVMDEIADPLFKLKINNQSSIIKTALANHIVVLENIKPSRQLTIDEVEKNISSTITDIDTKNYLIDLENNISEDILNGMDLNTLANKYNLNLLNIENITRDYGDFDDKDSLFYESFITNAFNANVDFVNDIARVDENIFYIYKVTNISFSEPLNFNEIKNIVLEDWKASKKIEEIKKSLKNNQKNNNFIDLLASKYKTTINQHLSINNTNSDLPKILISDIFSSDINTINIAHTDNEIFIAKTLEIKIPKNDNENSNKIQLLNDFKNILNSEILKNAKISINDKLMNAIIDSY